jgi:hypothetical protein
MATPLYISPLHARQFIFFFIKYPSFLLKINSDIKEKARSMVKMIFWRKLVQDEDGGKIFIKEPFHTNI